MANNQILYHYCGVEAFYNIIKNGSLWLTDIRKSNDALEFTWIQSQINNEIQERLSEADPEYKEIWNDGFDISKNSDYKAYAICFSSSVDSLSQWRGYAQDGTGLAIGFSKTRLQKLTNTYGLNLKRVVYNPTNQREFIEKIIDDNFEKLKSKPIFSVAIELNQNYNREFIFFKNPSFSEEKEWRMTYHGYSHKDNDIILTQDVTIKKPKFRVNDGQIISGVI